MPISFEESSEDYTTNTVITIPSKNRSGLISKSVTDALATGIPVHVVVEPPDEEAYVKALPDGAVLHLLDDVNRGVGYARERCLEVALDLEVENMIMVDDDVSVPTNVSDLVFALNHYRLSGVCGWFRVHKHLAGIVQHTGVHPHTGSLGARCYAVRVEDVDWVGGFDDRFITMYDDFDLFARLISEGFGPWSIHSSVELKSHRGRHAEGGNLSVPGDVDENEIQSAAGMVEKHGQYVTMMKNQKVRMNWKRLYTDNGYPWPLVLEKS